MGNVVSCPGSDAARGKPAQRTVEEPEPSVPSTAYMTSEGRCPHAAYYAIICESMMHQSRYPPLHVDNFYISSCSSSIAALTHAFIPQTDRSC